MIFGHFSAGLMTEVGVDGPDRVSLRAILSEPRDWGDLVRIS